MIRKYYLALVVVLVIALSSAAAALAQVPQLPHLFFGSVTVASSPAPSGRTVEAKVDGVVVGTLTTTETGKYGGPNATDAKLLAQGSITAGSTIEFFVDGVQADQTFAYESGAVTELNLTAAAPPAGGGPPPAPRPTATSVPAPAPAPAPAPVLLSFVVSPPSSTIAIGGTVQITALGTFSNGTTSFIGPTWSSSDVGIVTINTGGVATGVAEGTATITATHLPTGITGTATITVSAVVQETSPEQTVTIETTIVASEEEITAATDAVVTAIGTGVAITADPIEISSQVVGIVVKVPATGVTAGQAITGDLDFTLGNLTVDTTDGVGTATIDLGGGLSVTGDAVLTVTAGGIDVAIEEPQLVFEPEAPDATLLAGGSGDITEIGVAFNVDLENLPDGASISVQFAKDASAFVDDPGATFQLAAELAGGLIQNVADDVAFVVKVTKSVITNQDLGTNTMTMTVSKAWYDQKMQQGKDIVITKIDDNNNVFTVTATCVVSGDTVTCTAEFVGAAGGFSVFALIAVAPAPTPTPTPVPSPTATPTSVLPTPVSTPTATSTPTPKAPVTLTMTPTAPATPTPTATTAPEPGRGTPIIWSIVGGLVALIIAAGAAYYFLVKPRGDGTPA